MLNVTFAEHGEVVSDGRLESWAEQRLADLDRYGTVNIDVGAETMVTMLRALIVRGSLKHTDVVFIDGEDGTVIKVNEYGSLASWPKGFCDKSVNLMVELLEAGRRSRKIKKEINGENLY